MLFIIALVALVIFGLVAYEFYIIAVMKGHDESKYFWISFLFPLAGWLMVIALPDRNAPRTVVRDTVQPNNTSDELPEL